MHARISMSELNEGEDRSMIAHARDECAQRVLFFSEFLRTIGQFWTVSFSLRTKVSQTLQSVLCINTWCVC